VQLSQIALVDRSRGICAHNNRKRLAQIHQHLGVGVPLAACGHTQPEQVVGINPVVGIALEHFASVIR